MSFEQKLRSFYQTIVKRDKEQCIMEEIKNNNQQALANYESLVLFINEGVNSLKTEYDVKKLRAVDKIALNNVIQLKSKIIERKTLLEKRLQQNGRFKITESSRDKISSYNSFMSAFKSKPKSNPVQAPQLECPGNDFKLPTLPQQQSQQIPSTPAANETTNRRTNGEQMLRKSLDLPRQRKQQANHDFARRARSKSPTSRRESPRSNDLTISQAALLAWDAKQKAAPSFKPSSPPPQSPNQQNARLNKNNTSQNLPKRKYDYIQPSIHTQINLAPIGSNKVKSPQIGAVTRKTSQRTNSGQIISYNNNGQLGKEKPVLASANDSKGIGADKSSGSTKYKDPRISKVMNNLQGVDRQACEQILNEILVTDEHLTWDDLAGLSTAKKALKETVVYPFLRPDLFKGLREPITGMLLFGPPGTGKTMIAKTVANEANSTFFSISASSLLSKYLGESEKLIRALFYLAKMLSPSIIFFDEIDSLLSARSDNENESSRRVKTEFLIQWSSLSSATTNNSNNESRVLVLAATNLPWAIDEAARRRFTRRLYIPLPEFDTRLIQLKKLFQYSNHSLSETDFIIITNLTDGYSNSDITSLAKEAAMEPIRDCGDNLMDINHLEIRGVELKDFEKAIASIKKSVGKETLTRFEEWANRFGSMGA